ncbi:unnamed protein product [Agarophyton chilense]|eukprot:gb/GEZJ01001793.1/.p1 GENE.gb/GEZJ01001793.1/~~gb/GEZJ01001793.1/.p1  ORF type:complete len:987 (-),score=118.51 gb/GEZJ01001793.1/:4531-7491(-)
MVAFIAYSNATWLSRLCKSKTKSQTSRRDERGFTCSASLGTKRGDLAQNSDIDGISLAEEVSHEWEALKSVIPFREIRNVSKPGQYLGNEFGAVNKPWNSVKVHFCLAYPDLYSIGMSSTGHIVLYSCLNEHPDLLCDRSYLPAPDMQKVLREYKLPIFGVESKRPLSDFDVIGMSLMYELGATNCVKVMEQANIPCTWAARDTTVTWREGPPLVFAGGLSVTANPEPYADLFDFMSIGDGEEMLPEIGECLVRALEQNPNITREEILARLAKEVSGVYVPRFFESHPSGAVYPVRGDIPAKVQKRNSLPQPWRATHLVPLTDPVHDRLTVEIRRGCTRGCRFCLPGMVQRPARDVNPSEVIKTVKEGVKTTGYDEFSLLSLSCSDWLSLPSVGIQLKNELHQQEEAISLSLGSQRVDRFDEHIADVLDGTRKSGLTFAPEAGTQRMRDVINKGLTNDDLLKGVKLAYDSGYQNVKLYFMINLPSETDDDVMGIAETIKWLQRKCRAPGRRRLSVTATISTFTPKSWTPFQWHSTSIDEVKRKQRMLKYAFKNIRDVKLSMTDPMLSAMEDFIGRGDRRLGNVILRAHELGAGMDAWWENMKDAYDAWCRAINEAGLQWKYRRVERGEWNIADTEPEQVQGPRGWYNVIKSRNLDRKNLLPMGNDVAEESVTSPLDRPLPWDHIDVGLDKGWLRDELMRALTETLTPDCAFNECSSCGVCGEELGNNITIPAPETPAYKGNYVPISDTVQRIRIAFQKKGSMALASQLDLNRLFDRLLRRASIPISFTGGYHPHPRIVNAAALPFGCTSSRELVDFFLRKEINVSIFSQDIDSRLPEGMKVVGTEEIPVESAPLTMLMEASEYVVAVDTEDGTAENWQEIVSKVQNSGPVIVEKVSKKGNVTKRDLRNMLYDIRLARPVEAAPVLDHVGVADWPLHAGVISCTLELRNEGALSPEAFVDMINIVIGTSRFHLLHAHRSKIVLRSEQ